MLDLLADPTKLIELGVQAPAVWCETLIGVPLKLKDDLGFWASGPIGSAVTRFIVSQGGVRIVVTSILGSTQDIFLADRVFCSFSR